MTQATDRIARARYDAEAARRRFASTVGALQYRLKPGTLVGNAWDGVRDKGGTLADEAIEAVRQRPAAASGIGAAILLFVARAPLRRFITSLFSHQPAVPPGTIEADLGLPDRRIDLTAPVAERSRHEGVSA